MKGLKMISNYCKLYRVAMPTCDFSHMNCFVVIDSTQARVLTYQRTKLLGQIVSAAMKRGIVFYVNNGSIIHLTWDIWKEFWNNNFTRQPRKDNLPVPHRVKCPGRSIFEECKGERSYKRGKSGGFNTTFSCNLSLHRLGSLIPSKPLR